MNEQSTLQNSGDATSPVLKKTLDIICGKWRLFIIYQLAATDQRYADLRRKIPAVSEKVLVQELKALISLGVIEKKLFSEVSPRVEYGLTTKGQQVLPTLLELTSIGEAFLEP